MEPFLTDNGCNLDLNHKIELMFVRGVGVRDRAEIEKISIVKVLSVLTKSHKVFLPKLHYYDEIEVDELWTYVGNKKRKLWLFYAYHRALRGGSYHGFGGNVLTKQYLNYVRS